MDYSHATYFEGGQVFGSGQAFGHPNPQYTTVPPLTPSHSNSATSDDYQRTSPSEIYDQYHGGGGASISHPGPFASFDGYSFAHQPLPFAGPSSPSSSNLHAAAAISPPVAASADIAGGLPKSESDDLAAAQSHRHGSNSDDEELTPAQTRRKAQNRAAQRAFRERKERHVKDLETRLEQLEAVQKETSTENERLKRDLQKVSTENEILRATSVLRSSGSSSSSQGGFTETTGPMAFTPTDFYSHVLRGHANKTPSHRVVTDEEGERLLAAGATWDFIVTHELYKKGLMDITVVSDRLRGSARCDGQGPVFSEKAILAAIEASAASGSDELL